jgi:uncharacterized protein (TIGR03086 family)
VTTPDFEPVTSNLAALVRAVGDDQLDRPTPCPEYSLGDLLDHVGGLAMAFTAAATKAVEEDSAATQPPSGDAARLTDDWRERIATDLDAMAAAWRDPAAWQGMTKAGGLELPGEVAAIVALDEVVVHGWDVARSLDRPYEVDDELLGMVHGFVSQFSGPGQEEARQGLFGPEVPVDARAPLLDRVLGMTGRDPRWSADRPVAPPITDR